MFENVKKILCDISCEFSKVILEKCKVPKKFEDHLQFATQELQPKMKK